jgi:hypothetical protein
MQDSRRHKTLYLGSCILHHYFISQTPLELGGIERFHCPEVPEGFGIVPEVNNAFAEFALIR